MAVELQPQPKILTYDRPSAQVYTDKNGEPHLDVRSSKIGACRRQLAYHAYNVPPSNPMTPEDLNRVNAGTALEGVVISFLRNKGWTVESFSTMPLEEQPQLRVPLSEKLSVTGIPDARASHPDLTNDHICLAEIKTRSQSAWNRKQRQGYANAHPEAVSQLGVYRRGLSRLPNGEEFIDPEAQAILVTMSVGTPVWNVDVDHVPIEIMEQFYVRESNRIMALGELLTNMESYEKRQLPRQDFDATSWQCKTCPFRDVCRPKDKSDTPTQEQVQLPPQPSGFSASLEVRAAEAALHLYQELQVDQNQLKYNKELQDEARAELHKFLQAQKLSETTLEGVDGKRRKIKEMTSTSTIIDYELLRRSVSADLYREIVTKNHSNYARVF